MKSSDIQYTQSSSTASVSLVAWIQKYCKTFTLTFVALVLMTIGFCLIMAGWFTPPTNDSVHHVRLAGPIAFFVGFMLLICSCLVCGIEQRRCCMRCTNGESHIERSNVERTHGVKSTESKRSNVNKTRVKNPIEIPVQSVLDSNSFNQQQADVVWSSGYKKRFRHPAFDKNMSVCEIHADKDTQVMTRCNSELNRMPTYCDDNAPQTRTLEESRLKRHIYQQESEDKGYYDRSTPNCSEEDDLRNSMDLEVARTLATSALSQLRQSTQPSRYNVGISSVDENLTTQIEARDSVPKKCERCLQRCVVDIGSFSHEKLPRTKTFHSTNVTTAPAYSSKRGLNSVISFGRVIEPDVHSVTRHDSSKRSEMLLRTRSMPGASDRNIHSQTSSSELHQDSRQKEAIDSKSDVKRINKTTSVEPDVRYSRPFCPVHDTVASRTPLFKSKMLQHETERFTSIDRTQPNY